MTLRPDPTERAARIFAERGTEDRLDALMMLAGQDYLWRMQGCQQSPEEKMTSDLPTTGASRSATRSARPSVSRRQRGQLFRSSFSSFFNQSIRTSRVLRS